MADFHADFEWDYIWDHLVAEIKVALDFASTNKKLDSNRTRICVLRGAQLLQ